MNAQKTFAGCACALSILLAGSNLHAEPQAKPRADADSAAELKARGDEAADALRFKEALEYYEAAYELAPDPALLYNRARAFEALERYPEALDALEQFDRKAPPELRARVPMLNELLAELRMKVTTLVIQSRTKGARVLLRGQALGRTPLPELRVNSGAATIEATAPGYKPLLKTVQLPGSSRLELSLELEPLEVTGVLRVTSNVDGARVTIDGKRGGTVPLELRLAPGEHRVEVTADGHEPAQSTVVVGAGAEKALKLPLKEKPGLLSRWWFWTAVGVVALGAAGTAIALSTEKPAESGSIPPKQLSAPLWSF